ncbi:EamA family transporter RarD [Campylobacter hyointestinalis subsp. hyointestinalis]|uniref:EamA family transporter RarD n=2 Tax=Campylobacter hyointestinalis TaxID=198 RepID=UPI000750AE3A|nr:EamA family transporter RarD [Campylobacter hyointestinalis]PPB52605.1 protein RarD [Campylobacter hyointestinalis subsp. hyointestinalis]PPB53836.1 protein RarD [Campylobacter hyointestinalis subsp. hyointestinalis]PPB59214.1 protein RarD [Campylobacter hyointestinalis subsp. hyointestinalis]PPB60688.1 protein RarD [Campylobacter hyointestinalis subsp. hyointestinalis]PPB65204.1 protein RarD [Campylobacter hyointestinalis subsp. hyointestinalis]
MDKKMRTGLFFGISTFAMWGVFPVYFKLLGSVSPTEILAHRIVWSALFLFLFLKCIHKLSNVKRLLRIKKVALLLLATGILIAINWGVFIYAVEQNKIIETSLGYFINPLISILLGAIILKEKLNLALKISLLIVFCAICIQIYALRSLPFISLILPLSFAFYGLLRKKVSIPSFEGLFIETLLLFPIALIYLTYLGSNHKSDFDFSATGLLLFLSGIVTILPLLTFSASTKYLRLSTIGFLQYISPTLSLLIAVFLYNETLDNYKLVSFMLIWISLALAGLNGIWRKR